MKMESSCGMGLAPRLILAENEWKEESMSAQESAQMLISHANDYVQNGIAATNQVSGALNSCVANLARVQEITTETMSVATTALGSGHPALGAVGATANVVSQKAEAAIGAINAAIDMMIDLDQSVNNHSNTMGSVGNAIMQGGSWPMTIMDDVARLKGMAASDSFPTVTLRYIQQQLNETTAAVSEVLGPALISSLGVGVTSAAAVAAVESAIAACDEYKSAINDAADRLASATG
jgi:hypothetical protein